MKEITLNRFIQKIYSNSKKPQPTPITWLIGAGMSASAGIPLARGVSQRIALHKFLTHKNEEINRGNISRIISTNTPTQLPWEAEPTRYIDNIGRISKYLQWYDNVDQDELDNYWPHVNDWLEEETGKHFPTPPLDNPAIYGEIFKIIGEDSHEYISAICRKSASVNLSHLALAGILRDHGARIGNTVFTTNFDDLLLQALLSIGHSARIFGDIQRSRDRNPEKVSNQGGERPIMGSKYPQIVHLHGRHAGYHPLNTPEEIGATSSYLLDSFQQSIRESILIIVGYSGWDDRIMETLSKVPSDPYLTRKIYWATYQPANAASPYLSNSTRDLIERCLPSSAELIVANPGEILDADRFMLSVCRALNEEYGGFETYRKEIINRPISQHKFIISSLKEHPDFDPERVFGFLETSRKLAEKIIKSPDRADDDSATECRMIIEECKRIISAEDIEGLLKSNVHKKISEIMLMLGDLRSSLTHASEAFRFMEQHRDRWGNSMLKERADILRLKSEVNYSLGIIGEANRDINGAIRLYEEYYKDSSSERSISYGYALMTSAEYKVRGGADKSALNTVNVAIKILSMSRDPFGYASCLLLRADAKRLSGKFEKAAIDYNKSSSLFEKLGALTAYRAARIGLCRTWIQLSSYEYAKAELERIYDNSVRHNDQLSTANALCAFGDLSVLLGDKDEAYDYYQASRLAYNKAGSHYGEIGPLYEMMTINGSIHKPNSRDFQLLLDLESKTKNAYVRKKMLSIPSLKKEIAARKEPK